MRSRISSVHGVCVPVLFVWTSPKTGPDVRSLQEYISRVE